MKKHFYLIGFISLTFAGLITGQNTLIEGYVFEDNNRGFLNEAEVQLFDAISQTFVTKTITNIDGFFSVSLPVGKDYLIKVNKDLFFQKEEILSTKDKSAGEKVYAKIKLERKPGYIFDVTLAEKGTPTATVDAINGAKIEVYNNTMLGETLVIDSLKGINFNVTFERGNHYTILIRKEGFFNKRLEAYVDVEGCILCFEGVGTVTPGVSDVMSAGFQMGSVLANIELEPATLNRTIRIDNIYYDLDKYDIRSDAATELNKVINVLKNNPSIIIELGSHTDSRGGTRYNQRLSSQRAEAAVDYIIKNGKISPTRISSKGYGESELVNHCRDGVKCSETEHQLNRRTELKIVGFEKYDPYAERSLADILTEERLLKEVQNSGQIRIKSGESLPPEIQKTKKEKSKNNSKNNQNNSSTEENGTPSKTENVSNEPSLTNKEAIAINTSISKKNKDALEWTAFDATNVLIVEEGKKTFVAKMVNHQLNTAITDLMVGKKIFLEVDGKTKEYQFDAIDQIPLPVLNAFLKRLAMLKKANGWQLFPLEKDEPLPPEIRKTLGYGG